METLITEIEQGIATVTLNRPEKRNAFSDAMRSEFIALMEQLSADTSVRALVITGAGKGFCAGGDIDGMQKRMQAPAGEIGFNGWHRQQRVQYAQSLLHEMPKPTVAAVNGAASGLGADLALACDFVVASEHAHFSWSYILRGILPDGGGMYFLPRRVGLAKAKELVFTGARVGVDDALALGIVDKKLPAESLVAGAQAWARELSRGSAKALAMGKKILNQSFETPAQQTFSQGSLAQGICYTTSEHHQSVTEFLDKSKSPKTPS